MVRSFLAASVSLSSLTRPAGAGDAWLGGFLAYLAQDASLETCVAAANYCANVVIKHPGCTYPEKPSFDPKKAAKKVCHGRVSVPITFCMHTPLLFLAGQEGRGLGR